MAIAFLALCLAHRAPAADRTVVLLSGFQGHTPAAGALQQALFAVPGLVVVTAEQMAAAGTEFFVPATGAATPPRTAPGSSPKCWGPMWSSRGACCRKRRDRC